MPRNPAPVPFRSTFRVLCLALAAALLLLPAADAFAQAAEKVKEAIRLKATGKGAEALDLYERTLEADKSVLGEADGGLKEDLFARYQALADGGDMAALLKLGLYYDMFGQSDRAAETLRKAAAGKDEKVAAEAKAHLAGLQKEAELARASQPPAAAPAAAEPAGEPSAPPEGEPAPAETPAAEQPAPGADLEQKKAEIAEKIKALEAEMATAEEEMLDKKRDWKKADGGNYNGDSRRRYRQAKEVYDGKVQEIEALKEELNKIESGQMAAPAEETPQEQPPAEEPPPAEEAPPADAPAEE